MGSIPGTPYLTFDRSPRFMRPTFDSVLTK